MVTMEKPSIFVKIFVCFGYYVLALLGWFRVLLQNSNERFPPIHSTSEKIGWYYLSRRLSDCWGTPICGVPGPEIVIEQRACNKGSGMSKCTGEKIKYLNLASYNYLGFADNKGRSVDYAIEGIYKYGLSMGATRQHYGTTQIHVELEKLTGEYVGAEDSLACGIGFTVNSLHLPMLLTKGCLVLSDEKNHASLIVGIRASRAVVRVFRHNDVAHLESLLKQAIYYGQKGSVNDYEPWKKIFIIVEGVYSMEGTTTPLPEIIALKKKFKAYLYLDEAHSIGVMGKGGRGVIEYFGCNPKDVDIIMGTYTKSFGAAGGYIAGNKLFISYMRSKSYVSQYLSAMSPPIAAHIVDVFKILMQKDGSTVGTTRISSLARNSKYFRRRINQMGLITNGCEDSPVVPILCFYYSKTAAMIRHLRERRIASAGVVFPITSFMECCIRVCLSASHTKEQLDYALKEISELVEKLGINYSKLPQNNNLIEY